MKEKERCEAILRDGNRCINEAVLDGLCIRHYSMLKINRIEK